ncbi:MAG: hypothetical protein Q8P68_00250 [Candidatus Peregrinibacteria bacterium]|nr:hypothetical protein [Candidatus Peregrinibacteria bacterium]MDZ4244598.1 hypothetical protein [Candidatus Gracilibacteria bacterium]
MTQFSPGITKAFSMLGLNQKQIIVLSHLYASGRVRVHEISPDISVIKRTELYSILNFLVKVQLVDKMNVNNVTCFELKSNSEIIRWANRKRIQAEDNHHMSVEAVARIKELLEEQDRNIEPRPFFHYLEGVKGLETAHKVIMPSTDKIDIYMNYSELLRFNPEYERLIIGTLKDNIELKIRIIFIGNGDYRIPKKLHQESQLFLRQSRSERNNTLLCIGSKWIIDFNTQNNPLKGFYMHCQNFDCMKIFKETFEKDWEDGLEIDEFLS